MASLIEKVIIIDESDANVLFWEMVLADFGLQIFKTRAGAEGLQLIEKENIPLAIVAWELSSMPGTVLIQKAKESKKRRRMPFLIYSSRMSDEDIVFAKEMGLENLVPMPFDRAKVKEMLEQIISTEKNLTPLELKLRKMEDILGDKKPTEVLKMIGPDVSKKGPHRPRYKTIVGETFLQIGNLPKAMKAADEALEFDPSHLPALYLKGRLLTLSGSHDEAIAVLRGISNKNPRNIQSLVNLGSAYISADRIDEAKKTISAIQAIDAETKAANDNRGKIALKEGDLSLAAQLFNETQDGDDIARFYNSLGISLVAKGDYEKGVETYLSAIKLLSRKTKLHLLFFNLALAYRKNGNTTNEVRYLSESYLIEPSFEKAYASIARAVQEAKKKGLSLDATQLSLVSKCRKSFLAENPSLAEKIKERLEKVR